MGDSNSRRTSRMGSSCRSSGEREREREEGKKKEDRGLEGFSFEIVVGSRWEYWTYLSIRLDLLLLPLLAFHLLQTGAVCLGLW